MKLQYLSTYLRRVTQLFRLGPQHPIIAQDLTKEWQKTRVRFLFSFTFNYDDGQIRPDQTPARICYNPAIYGHICALQVPLNGSRVYIKAIHPKIMRLTYGLDMVLGFTLTKAHFKILIFWLFNNIRFRHWDQKFVYPGLSAP